MIQICTLYEILIYGSWDWDSEGLKVIRSLKENLNNHCIEGLICNFELLVKLLKDLNIKTNYIDTIIAELKPFASNDKQDNKQLSLIL